MNEKKAKRLRQLVKHLMGQGAIAGNGWIANNSNVRVATAEITRKVSNKQNAEGVIKETISYLTSAQNGFITGPVTLDPGCGRAIYQKMKQRALTHRTH